MITWNIITKNEDNAMENLKIFNFSDAYIREGIADDYLNTYNYCDLSKLEGTDCYCSDEAKTELQKCADECEARLHYIDSGNYHYMSYFFLNKICRDFALVLFDHHPDTQKPGLIEMLSCGSWVWWSLKENIFLKKVYIIGMNEDLSDELPKEYSDKIQVFTKQKHNYREALEIINNEKLPIYVSFDKDVLDVNVVKTNWDQGNMAKPECFELLEGIISNALYIEGIDVCGEYYEAVSNGKCDEEALGNAIFNKEMKEFLQNLIK